ncbi:mannitol dehydrogenase [Enterococcus sp. AZ072]|uniref:mannitol dehydrogenase family protein n=1 Tax=unclassified Enterococcus TaxID=2608891 RepID=UPI003D2C7457
MKNVLIVGAGRLGKGFVGETFFNAGWNITFLDNDPQVIDELNKEGHFDVRVHTTDDVFMNKIDGYKAFVTDADYSVMDSFLAADLLMLPLYPEDFEESAKYLAKCFDKQYEVDPEGKKTLICLTNKNHIIDQITAYFRDNLGSEEAKNWFDKNVVVRDSIVRRSTDAETTYSTDLVTTAVAALIIQGPVYSDFSDVKWLDVRENVEMLKDIKVFTINGPHAATAYYGYLKGYDDIVTAQADPAVAALIKAVHDATVHAVLFEYPVTREEIRELEYLPKAKNEMPDAIYRVAYDPIRKVGPQDRFMGVIRLCQKYDINYDGIAKALACAFAYSEPADESAGTIQKDIVKDGVRVTVAKYVARDSDDEVVDKIVNAYQKLQEEKAK